MKSSFVGLRNDRFSTQPTRTTTFRKVPWIYVVALVVCAIGFSFPIYGFPGLGVFRLTLSRIGLVSLGFILVFRRSTLAKGPVRRVLLAFALLAILRSASLISTDDKGPGAQQLAWFLEGFAFLSTLAFLAGTYPSLSHQYNRIVLVVSVLSVGVMAVQYFMLFSGGLLVLPYSTSQYGFPEDLMPWTYPLYGGGRIIGGFYEPNMAGSMCAFFVAFALPRYLCGRFSRISWLGLLGAIAIAGFALVGTGSRQSIVASLAGAAIAIISRAAWKRTSLVTTITVLSVVCLVLGLVFSGSILGDPIITPFGETQENVFQRLSTSGDDPTGGRLDQIEQVLASLDVDTYLVGRGEGQGILGAHNAYLLALNQNGIVGLLLLIWLSTAFLAATMRSVGEATDLDDLASRISSLSIVTVWLVLIFANWAQLNQSVSYLFLGVPIISLSRLPYKRDYLPLGHQLSVVGPHVRAR